MTTPNTHQHRILIVEDESDMCLLLDVLLKSDSVRVTHAKSLFDAQLSLKHECPDLVLLDNRLPDGFGVDLIEHIKTHYPTIKIMMITGIDPAARDFALELGADTFLSKPFTKQQLRSSISLLFN